MNTLKEIAREAAERIESFLFNNCLLGELGSVEREFIYKAIRKAQSAHPVRKAEFLWSWLPDGDGAILRLNPTETIQIVKQRDAEHLCYVHNIRSRAETKGQAGDALPPRELETREIEQDSQPLPLSALGWCIEKGSAFAPSYLTIGPAGWHWTGEHEKALRFARELDAKMIAPVIGEYDRIAEHSWEISVPDSVSALPVRQEEQAVFGSSAADWERRYSELSTIHEVFCVGMRKALGITCLVPLKDILDVAIAMKSSSDENWQTKYGSAAPVASAATTVEAQKPLSVILDQIEQRANKARIGPWEVTHREPGYSSRAPRNVIGPRGSSFESGRVETVIACPHVNEDADFIAAARTDVPALVKALREARRLFLIEVGPDSWEHRRFDSEIAKLLREPAPSVSAAPESDSAGGVSSPESTTRDTARLDWLEDPLAQNYLFGTFVKGGSQRALRNAIDAAMENQQ